MGGPDEIPAGSERRLNGWRQIAAYCQRTESTVKRWAADLDFPVYRRAGEQSKRGVPVYAFPSEIDAWLLRGRAAADATSGAGPSPSPRPPRARRFLVAAAAFAVVVLITAAGWLAGVLPGTATLQTGGQAQASNVPEEARELQLRGTYLWNRRTPEGIAGAIDALTRAIEIHPDYAEAHASLAMTYNLARQYSDMSGWDAYAKAEEHARRAVELNPEYGFGQAVLAFVEFHWLWNVEDGLARFEKAIALDPGDANALMWYGSSLIHANRPAEALEVLTRAQELAPENTTVLNMKAQALYYSGREEAGMELVRELIERDPTHPWNYWTLASMLLGQLDHAGYLENYATLGDMIGIPRYRIVAEAGLAALASGGEEAMAEAMAELDREFYERGEALAWDIAGHYAMVGNWREAMPWLYTSLERREERLIGLKANTGFRPIRHRPEFRQLVVEVGYPAEG